MQRVEMGYFRFTENTARHIRFSALDRKGRLGPALSARFRFRNAWEML
jgi:hypothetical protein